MTSEVRFDTREPFALRLLAILDTSHATVVMQDGYEIVILFDLPNDVLANRVMSAETFLNEMAPPLPTAN